jgi:chromosome segregation ATPase
MKFKRWFAWACLALVVVAEVALFRAYRDRDELQTGLNHAQVELRQATDERDELRNSNAGLQAAEINRLRRQNQILTNQVAHWRGALEQLATESQSNAVHLAVARTALRLQQGHLEELQVQNDQILDASVTVIARKTCINNLRLIDDAKQLWAADNDKAETVRPTVKDLLPYFKDRVFPECPGGGTIYLNAVNEVPTCSVSGHALPQ